jgi:high-affinity Fe2+/Pb2+ permease
LLVWYWRCWTVLLSAAAALFLAVTVFASEGKPGNVIFGAAMALICAGLASLGWRFGRLARTLRARLRDRMSSQQT